MRRNGLLKLTWTLPILAAVISVQFSFGDEHNSPNPVQISEEPLTATLPSSTESPATDALLRNASGVWDMIRQLESNSKLKEEEEVLVPEVSEPMPIPVPKPQESSEYAPTIATTGASNILPAPDDVVFKGLDASQSLLDPVHNNEGCRIMPVIQTCRESNEPGEVLWFYDQIEKRCLSTSDCILNENSFASEVECQSACLPKLPLRKCLEPPKAGYAQCQYNNSPAVPTWTIQKAYFDKVLERCSWFVYLGCGDSENQFQSIEECNETCMSPDALETIREKTQEICQLPNSSTNERTCAESGQTSPRWYYDPKTQLCREFGYTHCSGTPNNFLSKSSCEVFCGAKSLSQEAICELSPEVGDCQNKEPHRLWYYDSGNTDCFEFAYTGCGGNENRFPSKASCLEICRPQQDPTVKSSPLDAGGEEEEEPFVPQSGSEMEAMAPPGEEKDLVIGSQTARERLTVFPLLTYNLTNFTPQSVDMEPCRATPKEGQCNPIECQIGSSEVGGCQAKSLVRWFFNPRTSNCENFVYSGCGGTGNTFDTAQSCASACKQRIMRPERDRRCDNNPKTDGCYSIPVPQDRDAATQSPEVLFYFSVASGTCRAFHLKPGRAQCGHGVYFADGQDCLKACVKSSPTEEDLPNRCFARKLNSGATKCPIERHNVSRWSYLPDLQQCVLFSECHTPDRSALSAAWGNNFDTKELCEATCMPKGLKDVCRLPKDIGPCRGSYARYYHDPVEGKCRLFIYGGCLGNGNRFVTKDECESTCGNLNQVYELGSLSNTSKTSKEVLEREVERVPPVPGEVFDEMRRIEIMYSERYPWDFCLQHHTYGTCPRPRNLLHGSSGHNVHLKRYFFNRISKNCEPYFYTGCGARGNHFETKKHCDNVCARRLRRSVSPVCDASNVEECPGSGLKLWIYEADAGSCRQLEACVGSSHGASSAYIFTLEMASSLFNLRPSHAKNLFLPGTFASSSACYSQCLPRPPSGTDVTNICHMNPITSVSNDCRAMGERWYFDLKDGYCRSYISCPVYGNNFADEETCTSACRPKHISDVCRLPLDYGGCSRFLPRWYYNTERRRCEQFAYGGCFGNSNRFLSKSECDSTCAQNDVCGLPQPKEAADNEPSTLRYYFNKNTGECEKFFFGGKIPLGNNFANQATCYSICISTPKLQYVSVKMNKMALSMDHHASKFALANDHPVVLNGRKMPCLSSQQLLKILKNETIQNCLPDGTVTELAYAYDGGSNTCYTTTISVCLEYPNEPYRIQILGRPLIFESQVHCEQECIKSDI